MISLITLPEAQQRLAKMIRDTREQKGLTRNNLAEKAGVSVPTLRKLEKDASVSVEVLLKIILVLGLLDDFYAALKPAQKPHFQSIDDILAIHEKEKR